MLTARNRQQQRQQQRERRPPSPAVRRPFAIIVSGSRPFHGCSAVVRKSENARASMPVDSHWRFKSHTSYIFRSMTVVVVVYQEISHRHEYLSRLSSARCRQLDQKQIFYRTKTYGKSIQSAMQRSKQRSFSNYHTAASLALHCGKLLVPISSYNDYMWSIFYASKYTYILLSPYLQPPTYPWYWEGRRSGVTYTIWLLQFLL